MILEHLELETSNGIIRGKITKPFGNPVGVLVCLHGSPGGSFHGNNDVFDQIADNMVPHGFATIRFSFYGATPSDGSEQEACIRTQLSDYESILQYTKSLYKCPIYVVGESAGATIASLRWKDFIKSYLLLWPAFDLKDTDLGPYLTPEWWTVIERDGYINDNGVIVGKELYIELLTTDFSSSFKLPNQDILLIHGQADLEVPYSQSVRALSNANGYIKFITRKEAGHGFKDPNDRLVVIAEINDWLLKML